MRLFRRYFWVVHLAFLSLAAVLVARPTEVFIGSLLTPPPSERERAHPAIGAGRTDCPPLRLDALAKVTGLHAREPGVAEPARAPVRSRLQVRLLGTLVNEDAPEWSVAAVQDDVAGKTATLMLHDKVQGAEVIEIHRERVVILNGDRRESVEVTAARSSPVAELDRARFNINDLATQVRVVPAFKNGQAHGFKLFSIRPDSVLSSAGLLNGDVITRINGHDVNTPEKILEVYATLKDATRLDVELERSGASVIKTLTFSAAQP